MKRQELVEKAFKNLLGVVRRFDPKRHTAIPVHTAITLAWVLDILPPHIDESTTDRLVGDTSKDVPIDSVGVLRFLLEVEA